MNFHRNSKGGAHVVATEEPHLGSTHLDSRKAGPDTSAPSGSVTPKQWKSWSMAEDRELRRLTADNIPDKDISQILGRSTLSVRCRRAALKIRKPMKSRPGDTPSEPRPKISPEAAKERDRAYSWAACRTVTQVLFGDPLPGRSALEQETAVKAKDSESRIAVNCG